MMMMRVCGVGCCCSIKFAFCIYDFAPAGAANFKYNPGDLICAHAEIEMSVNARDVCD